MKTFFLLLISSFAFGATESPFLSYHSKIDFSFDHIKDNNYIIENNNISVDQVMDCINIWRNCTTNTIHYSTTIQPPGITMPVTNIWVFSGPNENCPNGVLMYEAMGQPTTGSFPFYFFQALYCPGVKQNFTVQIQVKWGTGPGEYCYKTVVFPSCD